MDYSVDSCFNNYHFLPWISVSAKIKPFPSKQSNYVVVSFVAEFLNTISSLAITVFALVGWYLARKNHDVARNVEISLAYLSVSAVGIGSALFHATLKHYEQYMDEVPMLIAASVYIYIMLKRPEDSTAKFTNRHLAVLITVCSTVATGTYVFNDMFILFFLAYFVAVSFLVIFPLYYTKCFALTDDGEAVLAARRHFVASSTCFFLGFAVWLWEHFRCLREVEGEAGHFEAIPRDERGWDVKVIPLHALWHLGAGLGSVFYVGFLVCLLAIKEKMPADTQHCCFCWIFPVGNAEAFSQLPSATWGNEFDDEFDQMNQMSEVQENADQISCDVDSDFA